MAELSVSDRLQPSLLDRLCDDEPENQKEGRDKRILSMRALRAAVLRDLGSLLNSASLETTRDLSDFPLAARSVLNFGLVDLSGKTASSIGSDEIERAMRQAIWDYEPRLVRESVQVSLIQDESNPTRNHMVFELRGEIWGQPLPERIYLKTELDLDIGEVQVLDAGNGSR